ncbi:hypothetical protein AB0M72_07405 [Nocardiopsis dassonvillei]
MERVAVEPGLWARLIVGAADLPRTVQASLSTLGLLMSPSGSVRNAVAHLTYLAVRSRSTISEHLGAAQAGGWLTCLERGGNRADGATPSVYQATVPVEVWHRRQEFLTVFEQDPDQADLPVFAPGSIIPVQDHRGPTSEFSAQKINPSIPQKDASTWSSKQSSTIAPGTDPVITAVIEELAALTNELVSPAWAARCVSQIMRHRQVRHPIAYVVKTLQNAAEDGSLKKRFLPPKGERSPGHRSSAAPSSATDDVVSESAPVLEVSGGAPWDTASFGKASPWDGQENATGVTEDAGTVDKSQEALAEEGEVPRLPQQEIYRPGGRILAGLGQTGARELVKLRQQFAERKQSKDQTREARSDRARPHDLPLSAAA